MERFNDDAVPLEYIPAFNMQNPHIVQIVLE